MNSGRVASGGHRSPLGQRRSGGIADRRGVGLGDNGPAVLQGRRANRGLLPRAGTVGQVLEALLGKAHPDPPKQSRRWAKRLLQDKVQALIQETRQPCAGAPQAVAAESALGCFVRNVSRMQYGTFRAAGYFIGSGVLEAGCKTIIGGRCKQSGMFWSASGAENILVLRCMHSGRRSEELWKDRPKQQSSCNAALPLAA